ncbi:hypothetical protein scyTo_0009311 [Scyliorhinus torazame]|uniref:Major facilitator superfamily (MFS) profile domain-containing protein n=1 Tax=Scyliorhinus torazame TaxID=75743 RepID=A0A401NKC6_SCYTO|nr:hypothetical protein [Scyliorhinus torazame]
MEMSKQRYQEFSNCKTRAPKKSYTVEEAVETIGFGRFHILLLTIMGSTSVAEAMEIMLLAVISPVIRCEWRLEEWQVAMVTTMVFLGFMSCSWIWGYLADRYGRWKIYSHDRVHAFHLSRSYFTPGTDLLAPGIHNRDPAGVSNYPHAGLALACAHLHHSQLGTAFAYYGLVLTSSELLENNPVCGSKGESKALVNTLETCHCKMFESADYQTMIISTMGEFLFVPFSPFVIETLGRRRSLALTMGASGIFFLFLNFCSSRGMLTALLFILRALVSANFTIIYIYTAEVYPTTIRSLGLGSCSSMARIGAMVAPFVAQVLLGTWPVTALCLFSAVCLICSVLAYTLPIETKGRAMQEINPSTSSI